MRVTHKGVLTALLVAYAVLFPFYVFPSGQPQLADAAVVCIVLLLTLNPTFVFPGQSAIACRLIAAFAFYTTFVNFAWAGILSHQGPLRFVPFYLYNALLFTALVQLYVRYSETYLRAIGYGLAVSLVLQLALLPLSWSAIAFRQELFFNNPNQLGYFSLLAATIFLIADKVVRFASWLRATVLSAATILAALSLSKAAIAALGVLIVISLFRRPLTVLSLCGVALVVTPLVVSKTDIGDRLTARFESVGEQSDDSFGGRGYDRIVEHPELLILGAGEGAVDRFDLDFDGELHSSVGTVLFSYGLVGLALFTGLIVVIWRSAGTALTLYLLPVFAYGFTHQGIRFSLFWTTLATLVAVGLATRSSRLPPPRVVPTTRLLP